MSELSSGMFRALELQMVPQPRKPVVLRSGGPIMDCLGVDDSGVALCTWDNEGVPDYAQFPVACLYQCVNAGEKK